MKHVALDNTWTYKYRIKRDNSSTGATEAASGLTGLSAWFSATPSGAEIHADLLRTLSELAGTPGTYTNTVSGTVLRAQLVDYAGEVIYQVIADGSNILASTAVRVKPIRVTA